MKKILNVDRGRLFHLNKKYFILGLSLLLFIFNFSLKRALFLSIPKEVDQIEKISNYQGCLAASYERLDNVCETRGWKLESLDKKIFKLEAYQLRESNLDLWNPKGFPMTRVLDWKGELRHKKESLYHKRAQEEEALKQEDLELPKPEDEITNANQLQVIQDLPSYPIGGINGKSNFACEGTNSSLDFAQGIEQSSSSWLFPAKGVISAGTWAYPSGEMHLGMDIALPMYSSIQSPANGVVLYADAPVADGEGYLGNWSGWPAGGGNTIALAVLVKEKLYAVTFAHLSRSIFVSSGQSVSQSDTIALSGNSGNSSGPHTHVEVFEIHCSLEELVEKFKQNPDFSFGTGWNTPYQSSSYATRLRPELLF